MVIVLAMILAGFVSFQTKPSILATVSVQWETVAKIASKQMYLMLSVY